MAIFVSIICGGWGIFPMFLERMTVFKIIGGGILLMQIMFTDWGKRPL